MPGFRIDMINVGQGDATIIATEERTLLVDSGPLAEGTLVLNHIREHCGGELDGVVLTHVDDDHIMGLLAVLDGGIRPGVVYFNDPRLFQDEALTERVEALVQLHASVRSALDLRDRLVESKIPIEPLLAGDRLNLGSDTLVTVLSPTEELMRACVGRYRSYNQRNLSRQLVEAHERSSRVCSGENESSIVLEVECGEVRALLPSDACARVLREVALRSYEFVKIPHHGSWHNTTPDLVQAWAQGGGRAAISCGENTYRHPSAEVVDWFVSGGALVRCTRCHGTVSFGYMGAQSAFAGGPPAGNCQCGE